MLALEVLIFTSIGETREELVIFFGVIFIILITLVDKDFVLYCLMLFKSSELINPCISALIICLFLKLIHCRVLMVYLLSLPSFVFSIFRYYGGTLSEKMLGKCLKALGVPRHEYIVSTKCGRYVEGFDFSAERVTRSIDESLARLQLDYVDILQCHDIEFGSLDQVLN